MQDLMAAPVAKQRRKALLQMRVKQVAGTILLIVLFCACAAMGMKELNATDEDEARNERVEKYNAAVTAWETEHRPAFARLAELWVYGIPDDAAGHRRLMPEMGRDVIQDKHPDLLPYTQLRYEYRGPLPFSPAPLISAGRRSPWEEVSAQPKWGWTNGSVVSTPQELSAAPVLLSRITAFKDQNWKDCDYMHHGTLFADTHLCKIYKRASELCFRLHQLDGGVWAAEQGAPGCISPGYDAVARLHVESVGRYNSPPPSLSFDDTTVVIRSAQDPYLVAMDVTNGSMQFGTTEGERRRIAFILLGLAGIIAVLSFVLLFCCIRGIGCCEDPWAEEERRKKPYVDRQFDPAVTSAAPEQRQQHPLGHGRGGDPEGGGSHV